jgi:hypothetical protein
MPISSDPNATYPYILLLDRAKPDPLVFTCRFMSRRERREMRRLADAAFDETNDGKSFALLMESIQKSVTGWSAREAFTDDALSEMLSDLELWEVAREVPAAALVAEREKKASASSSTSAPARSVPAVPAVNAEQTNPQS